MANRNLKPIFATLCFAAGVLCIIFMICFLAYVAWLLFGYWYFSNWH